MMWLVFLWLLIALGVRGATSQVVVPERPVDVVSLVRERELVLPRVLSWLKSSNIKEVMSDRDLVLDLINNTTATCSDSLRFALGNFDQWFLTIIDAFGKIPPGVTDGSIHWLGAFDLCMDNAPPVNYTGPGKVSGSHYCRMNVVLPITSPVSSSGIAIDVGLCVPNTCGTQDLESLATFLGPILKTKISDPYCYVEQSELVLTPAALAMTIICGIFGVLLLLGSLYDLYVLRKRSPTVLTMQAVPEPREPVTLTEDAEDDVQLISRLEHGGQTTRPDEATDLRPCERVLLAFSVLTNGQKILDTHQQTDRLNCLDGVRFLSMSWVILGHSFAFVAAYAGAGVHFLRMVLTRWNYQVLMHADFSVDSFFVLSGLLTAYFFLKEAAKLGTLCSKKFWFLYFFHRYWRLTPPYMLFLGFYTALMRYWSNGPLWSQAEGIDEAACVKSWWANLLYINNFVAVKDKDACMDWTWYLANDMQFHVFVATIILPLIFLAVHKRTRLFFGLAVCVVLAFLLASVISTALIAKFLHLDRNVMGNDDQIYLKPWCRMGPYIIGLVVGYLILEQRKRKWRLHPILVTGGWVLAAGLCLSVIYGNSGVSAGNYQNSPSVNDLFLGTSRLAWALGVSWLLFACCAGYGGPVNRLLSWPAFIPLSRLTFFAYIIHPVVIYTFYGSLRQAPSPSLLFMIQLFLANLVASYLLAFVFSLTWEVPLMALERVILRR